MVTTPEPLWDEQAGPQVRPYALTRGRTRPSTPLTLVSVVRATGRTPHDMEPEHADVLRLCHSATAVVEVAARLGQPPSVAKVLLSDLIGWDAVRVGAPAAEIPDRKTLEAVLRGLRKRL